MTTQLTEHVLYRQGNSIHYWLGGSTDRPLVALLHGATLDHRMFNHQIEALLPEYQVLTWDTCGHGKSQPMEGDFTLRECARDLIAILDDLDVQQVVLVGQSMGGYIAQYIYLDYPKRVSAMVIIGATSIALPYQKWEIWALKATLPLMNLWPYAHFTQTVARRTVIHPEAQAYALDAIRQINHRDFLRIWKAVTLAVDEKGIPGHNIQVPLLLTHGDQDNLGTIRRQAPAWAAYEPDVEYVVIPQAGHNANQDNATFFNRVLLEFLSRKPGENE